MRIGVFGGTFDPVHLGHLVVAEQCRQQAALERVLFIPSARPPHKQERPLTPLAQRAEMLALALAGNPAFVIDELEKDRPGPSYTVDTLAELAGRFPGAELCLLIGADTLHDLPSWRQPAHVAEQTTLLVVGRPGWPIPPAEAMHATLRLPAGVPLRQQTIETPLIEISSRDLRRRVAEGRSIRYLVPHAVEVYIREKQLYRPASGSP